MMSIALIAVIVKALYFILCSPPKNLHPPLAPLFAFSPARNIRTAVRKTIATRIEAGRTPHIRNHRAPLSEALMRGAEKGRTQ